MTTPVAPSTLEALRPALIATPVRRAMQLGFVECAPETDLASIARTLADRRVHCLVVRPAGTRGARGRWRLLSDKDVLRALYRVDACNSAGDIATEDVIGVHPGDPLLRAAELMVEHGAAHVLVLSPTTNRPVGIVSSLDLVRVAGELATIAA
jgi:CBS domain-containing protein